MNSMTRVENKNQKKIIDWDKIRLDFPILSQKMNRHNLVYLDNAATTQKPEAVIDRISRFYQEEYSTVHRGVYSLSQESTEECEDVREKTRQWIGASHNHEIIFVKGATEGINLVAHALENNFFEENDEIIISEMEHHANIVPWQMLALRKKLVLKVIPISDRGELKIDKYKKLLTSKTKLVAVTHVSNVLGTVNPIREIADLAHDMGALLLVDGAQSIPHMKVSVRDLDCDFFCYSGHKMYGPTGVGVVYARNSLLERMEPYQGGGSMIESVSFEKTTFAKSPNKFEAGTPPIAQIIGLGAAMDYLEQIGMGSIHERESEILVYALDALQSFSGIRIIGLPEKRSSLISFEMDEIHPHDAGTILDQRGIAVRAGHHCAEPTMRRFGVAATLRASFSFYNNFEEVDLLINGLKEVKRMLT